MVKSRKPANRITDFTSIADYKASTAREGDIDAPIFDGFEIRRIVHAGVPHYSVVDIVGALTGQPSRKDARNYWNVTKSRLAKEGADQPLTICKRLKVHADDGKLRETDCADIQTLLRIVQSIPSPKAEPLKQWLAKVGFERIQETSEPSTAIDRAIADYRKRGRDDRWISDRIKAIAGNNEKTDQWKDRGVAGRLYAALNAEMSEVAFGITPAEHGSIKGLPVGTNRQDHMTRTELAINNLADTAATDIMVVRDTKMYAETRKASLDGADVARIAREALERQTGKPVVSAESFLPKANVDELPLIEMAKQPKEPQSEQSKRFIETARKLEADESDDAMDREFDRVVEPTKPEPERAKKSQVRKRK